jgi:hypothetical protein
LHVGDTLQGLAYCSASAQVKFERKAPARADPQPTASSVCSNSLSALLVFVWCLTVGSFLWPLVYYSRSLPDGQPDPRPMLYCLCKNVPSFVEIIAGIKQAIDLHAIARPFFDFVEVAHIGDSRVLSFFVGPIARHFIKGLDAFQGQHI